MRDYLIQFLPNSVLKEGPWFGTFSIRGPLSGRGNNEVLRSLDCSTSRLIPCVCLPEMKGVGAVLLPELKVVGAVLLPELKVVGTVRLPELKLVGVGRLPEITPVDWDN